MLSEFKKFAMRGNVVDLAIGFTVGAAFTSIAKSLVEDVIMPPVGLLMGRADFADLFWLLRPGTDAAPPYATLADAQASGAVTINYGEFVNNIIAFLLVAIAMFLIIKVINKIDREMDEASGAAPTEKEDPSHKKCPYCLSSIPYKATRCPQCTSQLEPVRPAGQAAAAPAP